MSAILNTHAQYYTYDMGKFLRFAKNILLIELEGFVKRVRSAKSVPQMRNALLYITKKSLEVLDNKAEQDCAAQAY